jgi:FkbM family methyltransferase
VLPYPEYASFSPRVPRQAVKFFHFIGTFRFLDDYYAARAQEVIAGLRPDYRPKVAPRRRLTKDRLPLAFTRNLTLTSAFKYQLWRALGQRYDTWLRARSGPIFQVRPRARGNNDVGVAYEIFVHRYYVAPAWIPPERVRLIVDLGANVGLSCLYWLSTYWGASVIAFEPHPGHVAQCRVNLARNGFGNRVMLHPVAAGVASGGAWISDAGSSSQLSAIPGHGHNVEVVDIFSILAGCRIDILKMDIEGSEYELLEDSRFTDLDIRAIVMEWHRRDDRPDGNTWCRERLHDLGFRLFPIFETNDCGMIWGYKIRTPADRANRIQTSLETERRT